MRKMLTVSLILCAVALLFTLLMPAVSAEPMSPLRSEASFMLNWDWVGVGGTSPISWIGTIWGDIEGDVTLSAIQATFPGILEHYSETWVITTSTGTITMYQEGVWSFMSLKFKSNGYVTAATGAWEYLVGSDAHVRGTTTPFPVPQGTPVIGSCQVRIAGYDTEG